MSIESKLLKLMEGTEGYQPMAVGTTVQIDDPTHAKHGTVTKIVAAEKDGDKVPMYKLEGIEGLIPHTMLKEMSPMNEDKKDGDNDEDDKGTDKADTVEDQPAVTIENPINPDLEPSGDNPDAEPPVAEVEANGGETADNDEDDKKKKVQESSEIVKGAFHRWLGKPEDADITAADIEKGLASNDEHVRKMAQFAKNMQHIHEGVDEIVGQEELSEEFKLRVTTLFEAKVTEKAQTLVEEKISQLEEEYQTKLSEAVTSFENGLNEKIDGYFGNLSEKWMKDNELALEASIKSDLTESFINGMKSLFESHYIDLPVEKFDIVTSLEEQLATKSQELENTNKLLEEQREELNKATREIIMENATKGMTDIDSSKFRAIMEDFEFEGSDTFTKRTEIIKESFFGAGKKESKDLTSGKLNVSTETLIEETQIEGSKKPQSDVAVYADFMKKTIKK
ncbi:MAG TPA: hypothetical protein VFM18_13760 [Methanosarcina sp.]|nr:hypothetical protein [Methanosarcina sp.]